ncbi:hypothetical protein GOODEAATRI_002682, partial [Goodea atripinnis]
GTEGLNVALNASITEHTFRSDMEGGSGPQELDWGPRLDAYFPHLTLKTWVAPLT